MSILTDFLVARSSMPLREIYRRAKLAQANGVQLSEFLNRRCCDLKNPEDVIGIEFTSRYWDANCENGYGKEVLDKKHLFNRWKIQQGFAWAQIVDGPRSSIYSGWMSGDDIIIKPDTGCSGEGITTVVKQGDSWVVSKNDRTHTFNNHNVACHYALKGSDEWVVVERLLKPVATDIQLPDSTVVHPSTFRVLTYTHSNPRVVDILCTTMKLTPKDVYVDNFNQSGNYITGITGFVTKPWLIKTGGSQNMDRYPIKRTIIPYMADIYEHVYDVAGKYHGMLIGWDVMMTDKGPIIIEGNSRPGITSMQVAHQRGLKSCFDAIAL